MPVTYNIVKKHNQVNPEAPPRYYPSVKSTGRVTMRNLAETIAAMSTVSSIDVYAVLEALTSLLPEELANGNIVELGDLGSFSIRARATGEPNRSDVSSKNITKLLPRFYPGKRFTEMLSKARFVKSQNE